MKNPKRHMKKNLMKGWRFGTDQTAKQEIAEIRKAQALGLEEDYMRWQDWSRRVEAERRRRSEQADSPRTRHRHTPREVRCITCAEKREDSEGLPSIAQMGAGAQA